MAEQKETKGVHKESQAELERAVALGHEPVRVSVRGLVIGLAVTAATLAGSLLLVYGVAAGIARVNGPDPAARPPVRHERELLAQPPVQPNQAFETERQRKELTEYLSKSGWINREAGVAHLSIEEAMAIYAGQLDAKKPKQDEAQKQDGAQQ